MSRAAACRSCMLAVAEFYLDSGIVARSLTEPLVELGRGGCAVGSAPEDREFAREEKDFNVSTKGETAAAMIARTCETGRLWTLTG